MKRTVLSTFAILLLLLVAATARAQECIVINEIMFAPTKPEPEWIELLNASADTISIAGWHMTVGHYLPKALDSANSTLPPDSMVVITASDSVLAAVDQIPAFKIIHVALPALSNSGSTVTLSDTSGAMVDSVSYSGNWVKGTGTSIERIDPSKPGYLVSNWSACLDTSGSTILRPNSVRRRARDLAITLAQPYDSVLYVTLANDGHDTLYDPTVSVWIGTIDSLLYPTTAAILPDSVAIFALPLPQDFFGLFSGIACLTDSLDENHANDSARFSIALSIPRDSLVINELMFAPIGGSTQWMELYNRSGSWISMDSAKLLTGISKPGTYSHWIPSLLIAPDSFAIVAADSGLFFQRYPSLPRQGAVADLNLSTLNFGKDSCTLVLHNPDTTTIDSVHYLKTWQQSLVRKTFTGISLERIDPAGGSNDPNNWHASLDSLGATPLRPNSASSSAVHDTVLPAGTTFNASFSPNPFSPDGDGFEDATTLTIQTGDATSTWDMRVRLFDTHGHTVRLLADAVPIIGATTLTFDGKADNGQTLGPGLYPVLVELTASNPLRTMQRATAVVIAGKRR